MRGCGRWKNNLQQKHNVVWRWNGNFKKQESRRMQSEYKILICSACFLQLMWKMFFRHLCDGKNQA